MIKKNLVLKFKRPSLLYLVTLGELCERFSYYGLLTILVLYLTKTFSFSDNKSFTLYGTYAAFAFGMPLLGGILADRLIGIRQAIIIGASFLILGNLLLAMPYFLTFCAGLTLCTVCTGFYKPNSTTLVGTLYSQENTYRESGFTLFYMGMNIGGMLGPIIYGLMGQYYSWHYAFVISSILLTISTTILIPQLKANKFSPIKKKHFSSHKIKLMVYIFLLITLLLIMLSFFYPMITIISLVFCIIISLIYLVKIIYTYNLTIRKKIFALIILSSLSIFFFAATLQVVTSINLFIERDITHTIFKFTIPTSLFAALYPISVIVMAPFLAKLWQYLILIKKEPSAPIKVSLALLFVSIGFIFFTLATITSKGSFQTNWPLLFILIGNLFLGIGELCLIPTLLSAISRFAPNNIQGTLIGVLFLFIAFAGYLSSVIAKFSNYTLLTATPSLIPASYLYERTFLWITLIIGIISILVFLLASRIKIMLIEIPKK